MERTNKQLQMSEFAENFESCSSLSTKTRHFWRAFHKRVIKIHNSLTTAAPVWNFRAILLKYTSKIARQLD